MSEFTANVLAKIAGRPVNSNMESVVKALYLAGRDAGLDHPHRLAHFLAQLAVETALWKYDQEIWGPTAAQKRYDTRTDLGNTPQADGDGKLYKGRGPIQVTGRENYTKFDSWVRENYRTMVTPDFVKNPDLINTDPWEGLSAIWYWSTRRINRFADTNNIEMVRRTVNGGLNGFQDCLAYYTRCALVLLGYGPTDVREFQKKAKVVVDGIAGPETRTALHAALLKLPTLLLGDTPSHTVTQPEEDADPTLEEVLLEIYLLLKPYIPEDKQ